MGEGVGRVGEGRGFDGKRGAFGGDDGESGGGGGVEARILLACVARERGDDGEAVSMFRKALALDPNCLEGDKYLRACVRVCVLVSIGAVNSCVTARRWLRGNGFQRGYVSSRGGGPCALGRPA